VNKVQLATLLTVGFAVAFIGWAVVYLASFPSHPDKDDQLATRSQFRSWLSAMRHRLLTAREQKMVNRDPVVSRIASFWGTPAQRAHSLAGARFSGGCHPQRPHCSRG
jgi:hypothetical protein